MDTITSDQNQRIKDLLKLQRRRVRDRQGRMALEGVRLVEEGFAAGLIQDLFITPALAESQRGRSLIQTAVGHQIPVWYCAPHVLQKAGETSANTGVIAVAAIPPWATLAEPMATDAFVVWADGLADPGNLGTIIRTAAAAGAAAVALSAGTVDPWNAKVVRSAMGAAFRIPLLQAPRRELLELFASLSFAIMAADIRDAQAYHQVDLRGRTVIVVGNEATGVHEDTLARAHTRIMLPMAAGVESLNASVAAAILLYECRRQRDAASPPVIPS